MADDAGKAFWVILGIFAAIALGKVAYDATKSHRCPRCNYPVSRDETICPNCGQPLNWRSR